MTVLIILYQSRKIQKIFAFSRKKILKRLLILKKKWIIICVNDYIYFLGVCVNVYTYESNRKDHSREVNVGERYRND